LRITLNQIEMHASQAYHIAVGVLQRIAAEAVGERGRRAGVGSLVLTVVDAHQRGESGRVFLARRAAAELEALPAGAERSLLGRVLGCAEANGADLVRSLVAYAAALEEARRLPEADAVMMLALALDGTRAEHALRAGRIARLLGDRARALVLYGLARQLDGAGGGQIARFAAIGEAVVADDPERALAVAIRAAVRVGDGEAAAVGLEERARIRRARGDRSGSARDLGIAAARFPDRVDRARVTHQLADLFVASNDPLAAREVLEFTVEDGDGAQREHARARMHLLARDTGDQVGMRRWRSFQRPNLVSLSVSRFCPTQASVADRVRRWRERAASIVARNG